jgi:hypothetical protein
MQGIESLDKQGRQWRMVNEETYVSKPPEMTPLALRMIELFNNSAAFARQWVQKFGEGKIEEAFLDTRPPAERAASRKTFQQRLAVARLAAAFAPGCRGPDGEPEETRVLYLPGYRGFHEGNLIQADPQKFWAPEGVRTELPAEAKKLFSLEPGTVPGVLQPENVRILLWNQDDQHVRIFLDYQLLLLPKYTASCAFVVEGDARTLTDANLDPNWRLASLDLRRGGLFSGRQAPHGGGPPR